jgi:ankyrin repeat protein
MSQPALSEVVQALYAGDAERAQRLADEGAALDLFAAASLGRLDDVRARLADGGPEAVHQRTADGFTALHGAAFFAQPAAARVLLDAGADVGAVADNAMRVQPLHSAAVRRGSEVPALLLDAGADPDARQQAGFTALHAAAHNGDEALVDRLLAAGADPTLRNDDGQDAASLAEAGGHAALADRLRPVG